MNPIYTSRSALNPALIITAVVLGLGMPATSKAQDTGNTGNVAGIQLPNMAGIAIGSTPDYAGADSKSIAAGPVFRYQFKDSQRYVSMLGPLASFNIIDNSALQAGPLLRYRSGRKDVDNAVVRQLHEIDDTVEAGAFVSYVWWGKGRVPWRAQISTEVLTGFSSADGTRAWVGGQFLMPVSHRVILGLGGSFNFIDGKTMKSYYGITPADSVASGLPVFQPGGGSSSNDLWFVATFLVNRKWAIGAGVYSQHLRGNAADSPWVAEQGSVNQITVGAGIAYIWK